MIAQTGAGKTFLVKNGILPNHSRSIVVDVEDGYDFPERVFKARSVDTALYRAHRDKPFVRAFEFHPEDERSLQEFERLCYGLLDRGHHTCVYVDESKPFGNSSIILPGYDALITRGRKRKLTIISGTQRPQMTHKDLYTQSTHHIWLFTSEYDVQGWLKETARPVFEHMSEIPFESFYWLYQAPDSSVHKFAPVKEYPWGNVG